MKKGLAILASVLLAGSLAIWKSVDTKVIKQTDEIVTSALKKSKGAAHKGSRLAKSTSKNILKNELSVKYLDFTFIKNGIKETMKVADFSKHSVYKTKLPPNLLIAKDALQFSNCLKSLRKKLVSNREEVLSKFRSQNAIILKRDAKILEANKVAINQAEKNMLDAAKVGNVEQEKIWLKELRSLTKDITFIETPRGKPMKFLQQEEILDRQIADIMTPSGKTQNRVFGYEWHHNEKVGVMELVPKDIHRFNKHKGGNYIWGNGVR